MASRGDTIKWLKKKMKDYRSTTNDIGEFVEDFDEVGKSGSRFESTDELEEVDIGDGGVISIVCGV
jgi:hypothetical protein